MSITKKLLFLCVATTALGYNLLSSAPTWASTLAPGVDFTSAGFEHQNTWGVGYQFVANADNI